MGPDDPQARGAWRAETERLPFAWIDLELRRDPAPARTSGPRPVLSVHLPPSTTLAELESLLETPVPDNGFLKIVLPATVDRALQEVLPALKMHSGRGPRCVMTTGPSGALLRSWAVQLGLSAVYGSLGDLAAGAPVEAAQIPVQRLRPFFDAGSGAPMFAVVGRPISHSRSPALHHFWMAEERRAGLYVALEMGDPEELSRSVPQLARGGYRGINVTHPLKAAALACATHRSAAAAEVGGANTLTLVGGQIRADNSDVIAIHQRIVEIQRDRGQSFPEMLVIGAGGAAAATLSAARSLGIPALALGRDASRSEGLAARFSARPAAGSVAHPMPLIVHATTVGRADSPALDVPLDPWIGPTTLLLDWVYAPEHPTIGEIARRHGATYEDGGRLLVHAAAASYGFWWGAKPRPELVERATQEVR